MAESNRKSFGPMRCIGNDGCGKKFETPLLIFDGNLICPYCGEIIKRNEFVVTPYNENLTRLGQLNFGYYLEACSYLPDGRKPSKNDMKKRMRFLKNAKDAFVEANQLGHPEAMLMLGYFWEVGYIGHGSSAHRYLVARHYYNNVKKANQITVGNTDKGNSDESARIGEYEIRDNGGSRLVIVREEAQKHILNLNEIEKREKRGSNATSARRNTILDTLQNIKKNKGEDIPLFGYFILSHDEFVDYYSEEKSPLKNSDSSNLSVYYRTEGAEAPVQDFTRIYDADKVPDAIEAATTVYVAFFNRTPKLPKKLPKGWRSIADGDADTYIKSLMSIEDNAQERTFYPADLLFAKGRNFTDRFDNLAAYLLSSRQE